MPADLPVYQEVYQQIEAITRPIPLRRTAVKRLALLVSGIIAAKSTVLRQVAAALDDLELTQATMAEHIERRLRRTLKDHRLQATTCYRPALRQHIDWQALRRDRRWLVVIIDESSKRDQVHLFRASLAYGGGSVPLAWAIWRQNTRLEAGAYWQHVDQVLAEVAAFLPADLPVLVLADRAFDYPTFIDRLRAYGWHWIIRLKANGTVRFCDWAGQEWELATVLRQRVPAPGRRWKVRGRVFKDAGWREASVVALWAPREEEPLVVLTDLPPRWEVLRDYGQRAWIEPGFRNDKSRGWQWEASQVRTIAHQERLLLAMAWASLVLLCLGVAAAQAKLAQLAHRPGRSRRGRPPKPQHARDSLFSLGWRTVAAWLRGRITTTIDWGLGAFNDLSWNARWYHAQALRYIFKTVRP